MDDPILAEIFVKHDKGENLTEVQEHRLFINYENIHSTSTETDCGTNRSSGATGVVDGLLSQP